nr:uncharacterized protein LOC127493035 [Oryctolagus cuniculus]XP_051710645.1 uncharacterized protein LOC127493035 [Oryctolagus cuniculus]XP_051710646.1 uncharacterized protein LOC127493035 [Oryctolagus cuniculus]
MLFEAITDSACTARRWGALGVASGSGAWPGLRVLWVCGELVSHPMGPLAGLEASVTDMLGCSWWTWPRRGSLTKTSDGFSPSSSELGCSVCCFPGEWQEGPPCLRERKGGVSGQDLCCALGQLDPDCSLPGGLSRVSSLLLLPVVGQEVLSSSHLLWAAGCSATSQLWGFPGAMQIVLSVPSALPTPPKVLRADRWKAVVSTQPGGGACDAGPCSTQPKIAWAWPLSPLPYHSAAWEPICWPPPLPPAHSQPMLLAFPMKYLDSGFSFPRRIHLAFVFFFPSTPLRSCPWQVKGPHLWVRGLWGSVFAEVPCFASVRPLPEIWMGCGWETWVQAGTCC